MNDIRHITPVPVWLLKLSNIEPGQYLDGRLQRNSRYMYFVQILMLLSGQCTVSDSQMEWCTYAVPVSNRASPIDMTNGSGDKNN